MSPPLPWVQCHVVEPLSISHGLEGETTKEAV
jgi:hypothetical protein